MRVLHTSPEITPEVEEQIQLAFKIQEERRRAAGLPEDWWREFQPRVLPSGWRFDTQSHAAPGYLRRDGLFVLSSATVEADGKRWLHVSASRNGQLPSWSDLREVKDIFIGRDRYAYQVLPPQSHYVNFHPNVLHLWVCLDGDPLPDFTRGLGII